MKLKLFVILLSSVVASVLFVGSVFATTYIADDNHTVPSDQTIDGDLFVAGKTLVIEGRVKGDVYAIAEKVVVKGIINGDLYTVAGVVEIDGYVRDDLVLFSESVHLGGTIGDSVVGFAETIITDSDNRISGSLIFAGSNLQIHGGIGRSFLARADTLVINAVTSSDVEIRAKDIEIGPDASIGGDLRYSSVKTADISRSAVISGEIIDNIHEGGHAVPGLSKLTRLYSIVSYLAAIVVGVVLLSMFRRPLEFAKTHLINAPGKSFGIGFFVIVSFLPVIFLLFISILGFPLAVSYIVVFGLALYFGKFVVALALGTFLLNKFAKDDQQANVYAAMIGGLSLVYLLKFVPVINIFSTITIGVVGLGAITLSILTANSRKHHSRK